MRKRLRSYFWFLKGLLSRHGQAVVISSLVCAVVAFVLVQFWPRVATLVPKKPTIIRLVGSYTPTTMPNSSQHLVSTGLTDILETGEVVPALTTSWDISADGKEYVFHLRPAFFWHDGKNFTANDINYNLKDVEFIPLSASDLKVKLKEPFSPLPSFLAKPLFRKGLVGLGSYKIAALELKGENVTYLKLTPQATDRPLIEFRFYPSESQAKTAFKLGEVTMLDEITDPAPFLEWKNVSVHETTRTDRYVGIFFNLNRPLLAAREMRQALAFALEKPEKNRIATPISSKSWAYTSRVKQYEQDVVQAKKLISQSATSAAELTLSTYTPYLSLAQTIAASWEAIGVHTQIKVESGVPQDFDALLVTQEIPTDPDQYSLWHSTQSQTNISHYTSAKIDKLLEDGRKEADLEKRKSIYFDFQRYLVEDAPAIFLFHPTTYTISRK